MEARCAMLVGESFQHENMRVADGAAAMGGAVAFLDGAGLHGYSPFR